MTIETGKVYRTKDGLRVVATSPLVRQVPSGLTYGYFKDPNGYQLADKIYTADLTGPLTGVQAAVKGSVVVAPNGTTRSVLGVCGDALVLGLNDRNELCGVESIENLERRGYTLKGSAADDGYAYRKDGSRWGKVSERHMFKYAEGDESETVLVIQPDETR